jgi:hypothetical protein
VNSFSVSAHAAVAIVRMNSANDAAKTRKPVQRSRLGDFENKVLSRIFGPKEEEVTGIWRNYTKRNFLSFTFHLLWLW